MCAMQVWSSLGHVRVHASVMLAHIALQSSLPGCGDMAGLYNAAFHGELDTVRSLLAKGVKPDDYANEVGGFGDIPEVQG